MEIIDVVGIDVSKLTIDVVIHQSKNYRKFENTNKGFRILCKWALSHSKAKKENLLFVFEHTGLYSYQLAVYLSKQGYSFSIVPGLEIKRSIGIARGKDDKVDAAKIARYAYRLKDEIQVSTLASDEIQKIKHLLTLRDRMVRQRAGYKTSLREMKRVLKVKENPLLFSIQQKKIKDFDKDIDKIEKHIDSIILNNVELKKQYALMLSIKGIGPQTAQYIIVATHGFTKFNNGRKFASYCGIAPFPNSSGTSIRGTTRVSHLANKKIKSLLDLAAKSAIQYDPEMKAYFNKRIEEGKHKRSVINIIRNKLVYRLFAVVKRGTPYVNIMNYAA